MMLPSLYSPSSCKLQVCGGYETCNAGEEAVGTYLGMCAYHSGVDVVAKQGDA